MTTLREILLEGASKNASDIHFRSGEKAWYRIHGKLVPGGSEVFDSATLRSMLLPVIPENRRGELDQIREIDFAWEIPGKARFRINCYLDIQGLAANFRVLPSKIMNVNQLEIAPSVLELCSRKKGLVLVTGPTGSGKSTTLAALLDYVNVVHQGHIVTIEDPIEFIFHEKKCLVTQREINSHTRGFSRALRAALREDPDIVMVGEMRDLETTVTALEVAETGHLVFSTLHTMNAASTVYRIINQFPKKKQDQIRISLASSLVGVVSQVLVPTLNGQGRTAVREILLVNHAVSNLIRENKIFQIGNVIQMSRNAGMVTLEDALAAKIEAGDISPIDALDHVADKNHLEAMLTERGLF